MFRKCLAFAALTAGMVYSTQVWAADAPPDLKTVVETSIKAMGAQDVKTLTISGEGWDGCVGQSYDPNSPAWRKFSNKNYVRSIDFEARGWRGCKECGAKARIRGAAAVTRALYPRRRRTR